MQSWANYFLGCVHYQWNDLEEAERYFAAIVRNPYVSHQLTLENADYGLALVHQARGEFSKALQIIELLSRTDVERIGYVGAATRSLRAWLMLLQGERDSAFRWANDFKDAVPSGPLMWQEIPHLTRAQILLASQSTNEAKTALLLLNALHEVAEQTHNKNRLIEIFALRAIALDVLGREEESLAELAEAVRISEIGDYRRVFLDLGSQMQKLLGKLAMAGNSRGTVERILAAFPAVESSKGAADMDGRLIDRFPDEYPSLLEPLTPREKQIVVLMQEPISFKDIAYRLGISYSTVKRHSVNIYGKLAVNSRWDAVARAIELDILTR